MDMVARFQASAKPRPAEARNIPNLAVNFVDINNVFQTQFKTFTKYGDPTTYTGKALDWYSDERTNMTFGASFQPVEQGAQPAQWTPEKGYYNPGQPSGV